MALTNLIDTLGLRKLFAKAEGGDLRAKEAIKAFQDSPELTEVFKKKPVLGGDIGLAELPPMTMPLGPQRPGLSSFTSNPTSPQNGVGGAFPGASGEGKAPTNWGNVASRAGIALSGIAQSLNPRAYNEPGGVQDARQRLQADQMAQLEQRHKMWGLAFDDSQSLPPEVLQDPQFATLAQAKAALDKDMMDGKVDNEKNVSMFLTELARYKPQLDQLSLLSKARNQAAGEGLLQTEREKLGVAEAKDYNFEGTPVTRTEYLRNAADRQTRQENNARSEANVKEAAEARRFAASEAAAARKFAAGEADKDRDIARTAAAARQAGITARALINNSAKQYAVPDPENQAKRIVTEDSVADAVMANKLGLMEAARNAGINVVDKSMGFGDQRELNVNGKQFGPDEEEDAMMYIYQLLSGQ